MTTPLPEPVIVHTVMPDDYRYGNVRANTPGQMRDYGAAEYQRGIEDAALACQPLLKIRIVNGAASFVEAFVGGVIQSIKEIRKLGETK